jgi:hypothetical protein
VLAEVMSRAGESPEVVLDRATPLHHPVSRETPRDVGRPGRPRSAGVARGGLANQGRRASIRSPTGTNIGGSRGDLPERSRKSRTTTCFPTIQSRR